ncbi:MAG: sulfatase-like hydrolase/transferase, partial [Myxococcales bacterium]|nr:sulfatase-like hydrolase/transferase [Myxococcales bacterium]
ASLFTGLAPSTHGAGFDHRWLDNDNVTLAEHLGANGYQTYAFSANPNLSPKRVNLLQGFEQIELSWGRRWRGTVVQHTRDKLLPRDASTEISPANPERQKSVGFYNAGLATHEAFTGFLDRRANRGENRPFFAYLSYMEAHKPRVPSMRARRAVADKPTIKLGLQTDLTFKTQLLYSYGKTELTDEELSAVRAVYDATLVDLDGVTADLLADLEARGVLDNTIVVFTSDHGEQLGEHQQFGHRSGVYNQLLHVPLVIAYPPKLRPGRVSTPVSNLDVFSTVLGLAGVEPPDTDHHRGNLAAIKDLALQSVFSESISIDRLGFKKVKKLYEDLVADAYANKYRAVIHGDHKLIETLDFHSDELVRTELYDVVADPQETRDLSELEPAKTLEMTELLKAKRAQLRQWVRNADDVAAARQADANMSAGAKSELEMLGYVQDDDEQDAAEPKDGGEAKADNRPRRRGKRKEGRRRRPQ